MGNAWLEILEVGGGTRRLGLADGRTRLGGEGTDFVLAAGLADELHVWSSPPRVVHAGSGAQPLVDGRPTHEAALRDGSRVTWAGREFVFHARAAAELVELPLAGAAEPRAEEKATTSRLLRRVQAGLLLDLGLADRATAKRWQEAVLQRTFEPDRCADEVLTKSLAPADDARMLDRAGGLLRDFLMAPLTRGARGTGRRARQAARGGMAFLVAQATALVVYTALVLVALVLVRYRGTSLDALIDRLLLR